jgi:hypothetical protein
VVVVVVVVVAVAEVLKMNLLDFVLAYHVVRHKNSIDYDYSLTSIQVVDRNFDDQYYSYYHYLNMVLAAAAYGNVLINVHLVD